MSEAKLQAAYNSHLKEGAYSSLISFGKVLGLDDSFLARLLKIPLADVKEKKKAAGNRVKLLRAHKLASDKIANDFVELRINYMVAKLFEQIEHDLPGMKGDKAAALLTQLLKERRAIGEMGKKLQSKVDKETAIIPIDATGKDTPEAVREFEAMYKAIQESEYGTA